MDDVTPEVVVGGEEMETPVTEMPEMHHAEGSADEAEVAMPAEMAPEEEHAA